MSLAIEVDALEKVYTSRGGAPLRALDGVSLAVPEGSIHGLLGPNGAGKSTFVKILSTVVPPTAGRVLVLGRDAVREPLEVRRRMAVVLQQTAAELLLTVRDNLLVYAYLHGLSRGEAKARVAAVTEEFELGPRLGDVVQELSGGTRRRIQVAKVFLLDVPLIVLDEATTGMDPLMKRRVLDRLRAEARKGRTILLTTQVLSEAEELCETITILDHGRTMASGTLGELRRRSRHTFRVALVFEAMGDDLATRLRALQPQQLQIDGKAVEMLFSGEESALLARLAEVAEAHPMTSFEVRGPSLEEIFVDLVGPAVATEDSP